MGWGLPVSDGLGSGVELPHLVVVVGVLWFQLDDELPVVVGSAHFSHHSQTELAFPGQDPSLLVAWWEVRFGLLGLGVECPALAFLVLLALSEVGNFTIAPFVLFGTQAVLGVILYVVGLAWLEEDLVSVWCRSSLESLNVCLLVTTEIVTVRSEVEVGEGDGSDGLGSVVKHPPSSGDVVVEHIDFDVGVLVVSPAMDSLGFSSQHQGHLRHVFLGAGWDLADDVEWLSVLEVGWSNPSSLRVHRPSLALVAVAGLEPDVHVLLVLGRHAHVVVASDVSTLASVEVEELELLVESSQQQSVVSPLAHITGVPVVVRQGIGWLLLASD